MPERQTEILEEMLNWIRFIGMNEARDVIDDALSYEDDEEKERSARIAYELTDGTNSTYDMADYIDFSYQWVSDRQMQWAKLGIVEKGAENQPYEHIASLTELGIYCPTIPESVEEEGEADEPSKADDSDAESKQGGSEYSDNEAEQPTLEDSVSE